MIILRVDNNEIFAIARNVADNSPAVSFGRRALPRDFNIKKPSKIMIFRARIPNLDLRAEGPELKSKICNHHTRSDPIDEKCDDIKKLFEFGEYSKNTFPIFFYILKFDRYITFCGISIFVIFEKSGI